MSAATDRLKAATAKAKAAIDAEGPKEDTMAEATSTTTTGAARPKVNVEVLATSTFTISRSFPWKELASVFKAVEVVKQVNTPEDGNAYTVWRCNFVWRHAALAEVMGTPSLNVYMGNNGLYVSKNADYDIDGNKGKYSKLNSWAGKAELSKDAVDFIKALIRKKRISL